MLTVLIPCRNERSNIVDCIESARQLGGEIIVADCGSDDGTLELIQREREVRLIEREFVNYADFKNWAIPQAAYEWVFILDADERISASLAAEIRGCVTSPDDGIDAYWVGRQTYFLGQPVQYGPWKNDGAYRLFRRDACRYGACRVHESLDVEPGRGRRLQHTLDHFTIRSYDDYFAKYTKYVRWSAQDLWDVGKRTTAARLLLRPFLRFFWLYVVQSGWRDGAAGVQTCMLQAFFVTFTKQARLWEMEHNPEERADVIPFVRPVRATRREVARAA